MKEDLKEILSYPLAQLILLATVAIVLVGLIYSTNKNKQLSLFLQKISMIFFIFCLSNSTVNPFLSWSPLYIIIPPQNITISKFLMPIYIFNISMYLNRVVNFINKKFIPLWLISLRGNPFIWLLVFWSILSTFWSTDPVVTLKAGIILTGLNIFCLYLVEQYNERELFNIVGYSMTFMAFLSLFIHNYGNGRFSGIFSSKNELGTMMALNAVFWYLKANHKSKYSWLYLVIAASSISLVFIAYSSTGIFIFIALLFLSVTIPILTKLKYKFAVVAVISFISLSTFLSVKAIENMEQIFGSVGKDMTMSGRTELWEQVWIAIQQRSFFGYGPYGFWQLWKGTNSPSYHLISVGWDPPHAHNGYLDLWVALGAIGLSLFLISLLLSIVQSLHYIMNKRGDPESLFPLIFIVYICIYNYSGSSIMIPKFNGWFMYIFAAIHLSISSAIKGYVGRDGIRSDVVS